jgi:hypothetical protein
MGSTNRRLVEERYSLKRYLPRLLDSYREAIGAFEPRPLTLPGREVEVLLLALRARILERNLALDDMAKRVRELEGGAGETKRRKRHPR